GTIKVFNNAGSVDVIIDISGYYEPTAVAQGAQGAQGEKGDKGEKGEKGDKGDKGDTGDAILATLDCTAGQTITWNATSIAWDCTDPVINTDTLAALNCTPNQTVRWDGSAWVCRSEPIVATLSRTASPFFGCCQISDLFQAYSPNVDPTGFCFDFECHIRLVDVLDHTSCQVSFTGNSNADGLDVRTTPQEIILRPMFILNPSEPFYVNVSCTT
ncbi:MAG TPA: collagen-like protein, partial [Ilumatobacteraceae bacterium]|nr:collagen-like protein [Ilumatobacteraceae bacterium]